MKFGLYYEVLNNLAYAEVYQGKYHQAQKTIAQAIVIAPQNSNLLSSQAEIQSLAASSRISISSGFKPQNGKIK